MVRKLFAVNPAKVRISCRAHDWLGDTDLSAFNDYFDGNGGVVVLGLLPLTRTEQVEIVGSRAGQDAETFLKEAADRGLHEFLANPQNLLMLADVVKGGAWPETRQELFERATEALLAESNEIRKRSGDGRYSPKELLDAAGAACATRLLSDVEGISLAEHSADVDSPSYRSITMRDVEKVRAALGRRCFVVGARPESVDYMHRTVAEYLAARWLAKIIRSGLPLARVLALIGVDDRPVSELRGLHAWLAVMLAECSDRLIDGDPYGVLTYVDAASLSPSSRLHLLERLDRLSKSNPWFRSGNWGSPFLGALSGRDMIVGFRAILQSPVSNFGIRSLVVEAVAQGCPLPDFQDDLIQVAGRSESTYAERFSAVDALFQLGSSGRDALKSLYTEKLQRDEAGIRLRAEILSRRYGDGFGPDDVARLLKDLLECQWEVPLGTFYFLIEEFTSRDIPAVLDSLALLGISALRQNSNVWEVAGAVDRFLVRLLSKPSGNISADRLWKWLELRHAFDGFYSEGRHELRRALAERRDLHKALVLASVSAADFAKGGPQFAAQFHVVTRDCMDRGDLCEWIAELLTKSENGSERQKALYEVALCLSFRETARARRVFEVLYSLDHKIAELTEIRDKSCVCTLITHEFDGVAYRAKREKEAREKAEKLHLDFEEDRALIETGKHFGWLAWIAENYFLSEKTSPIEKLGSALGDANVGIAMKGLRNVLWSKDIPSLEEILELAPERRYRLWWIAIIAGLDEAFRNGAQVASFDNRLLGGALAIELLYPRPYREAGSAKQTERPWKMEVLEKRTELAHDVYWRVGCLNLERASCQTDGLYQLLTLDVFALDRQAVVLNALRRYPRAEFSQLKLLLEVGVTLPNAREGLLELARDTLSGSDSIPENSRDCWLAAAYLLAPEEFHNALKDRIAHSQEVLWHIRDLAKSHRGKSGKNAPPLTVMQLRDLASMAAGQFVDCQRPDGGSAGNQNAWDGSDMVHGFLNELSSIPTKEATSALKALLEDAALATYRDYVRRALANQQERFREVIYRQPNWEETLATLANGAPANAADLQALVMAHLHDVRKQIDSGNTDSFKRFWNEDQYGRKASPKPEESCRDVLVDMLRPRVQPSESQWSPKAIWRGTSAPTSRCFFRV